MVSGSRRNDGFIMNGIHDMGGMTCFGPIKREENEPVFHAEWERRVFALNVGNAGGLGPIDASRHRGERLNPGFYINSAYYERWLAGLEMALKEFGVASDEELAAGELTTPWTPPRPPPDADTIEARTGRGFPATRDTGRQKARFAVGTRVRARNINPSGHTRLPRYVRGHLGTVVRVHGTHVFPDTNAHGQGENPQPLYNVRFDAAELWGPEAPANDRLYIDLWEDYLEPAP